MTRLHERIKTTLPIEAAFDYVADFANAQEWDPGVASARRISSVRRSITTHWIASPLTSSSASASGAGHIR